MNNTTTTNLLTTSAATATRSEGVQQMNSSSHSNNTSSTIPNNIQHNIIATSQVPFNYSREGTITPNLLKNNSRSSSITAQEISSSTQGSFSEIMNEKISAGMSERTDSVSESKPTIASSYFETFTNPYHTPLLGTQSMIEPCVPIRKLPNLTINVNNTSGLPSFNPAALSAGSAKPNQISPPPPTNFPTIPTPPANFTTTTTTLSSGTCTSVLGNCGPIPFSFSKPTSSFAELGEIISQGNFGITNSSTYCNDTISCNSTTSSTIDEPKKVKNRKEKSLTMICTKFIQYYEEKANSPTPNTQSKGDIKIEEAVNTLGIEKRRIYDILNVLESISIVTKVGVSCYKFNGTKCLNSTLEQMKNNAFVDPLLFEGIQALPKNPQNEPIIKSLSKFKQSSMTQTSRSNTLTSLSRLLIMCFLATEVKEITQDQLLAIVLKDSTEKTRTRRLNDIVNILSAIHLLEKKTEKSVNIFKWLGGSYANETKPANSILSPSKMPLKKRKRVKAGSQGSDSEISPTVESGPAFSTVDVQPEIFSNSEISEISPISTVSPSFFQSGSATSCKTPTSSGSNSSGGLHFQFRSPPSKKNKTIPISSFTTVLGPKISPKNLDGVFKTSEQSVANSNVPAQSPTIPNTGMSTTFKLGSGSIFSQTINQVSPRVMPSSIKANIFNENNKENASVKSIIPQQAKKSPSSDLTQQNQQNGKITFKIRSTNETALAPRQPLGVKTDNGVNNQQNIKAPRP